MVNRHSAAIDGFFASNTKSAGFVEEVRRAVMLSNANDGAHDRHMDKSL